MKYLFTSNDDDTKYLPFPYGVFTTRGKSAGVNYEFKGHSVVLDIDDMYFSSADIEDLISFLESVKEILQK